MLEDLTSIALEARPNLPLDLSTLEALYREELVRTRFYALTDEGRVALADELGRLQSILDTAAGKALVAKPV